MKREKRDPASTANVPAVPFDDALRRMLSTPPDHKTAKKAGKTGAKGKK